MAYEATGIMPEELANELDLPERTAYLWLIFGELHSERTGNGMGVNPITSTEMLNWCLLNRTRLESWERRAIKTLDSLWMESIK